MTGSDVFAALADPTRRSVLQEVAARGSATATELAPPLGITRQAVAKHLAVLAEAGLVDAARAGRETRYRPTPAPMSEAISWMAEVGARWDERLAGLERQVARRRGRGGRRVVGRLRGGSRRVGGGASRRFAASRGQGTEAEWTGRPGSPVIAIRRRETVGRERPTVRGPLCTVCVHGDLGRMPLTPEVSCAPYASMGDLGRNRRPFGVPCRPYGWVGDPGSRTWARSAAGAAGDPLPSPPWPRLAARDGGARRAVRTPRAAAPPARPARRAALAGNRSPNSSKNSRISGISARHSSRSTSRIGLDRRRVDVQAAQVERVRAWAAGRPRSRAPRRRPRSGGTPRRGRARSRRSRATGSRRCRGPCGTS